VLNQSGEVELVQYSDFATRVSKYREEFNEKSVPYVLPEVRYLGSYLPEKQNSTDLSLYVAIPVKNQGQTIVSIIESLLESTSTNIFVGIIFDNCTDNSREEVLRFLTTKASQFQVLHRLDLLSSEDELFEATSENILFQFCSEQLFMSLQADIYFNDSSFIKRAALAFEQNPRLLGISGRAVVPFMPILKTLPKISERRISNLLNWVAPKIGRKKYLGPFKFGVGYFGDISSHPLSSMRFSKKQLQTIYPGEAVIRGPLIWRAELYRKLGGLNDIAFFLGRDDCDLCLRGFIQLDTFVGYLPCRSHSNPNSGTTRKPRTKKVLEEMNKRNGLAAAAPGILNDYWDGSITLSRTPNQKKRIRLKP
jgi:GT2 family glycosyltransferase